MLNFQTDYDEATGEQVLTCFLLPQMDYQVEQGEGFFSGTNGFVGFRYFFPPFIGIRIIMIFTYRFCSLGSNGSF